MHHRSIDTVALNAAPPEGMSRSSIIYRRKPGRGQALNIGRANRGIIVALVAAAAQRGNNNATTSAAISSLGR